MGDFFKGRRRKAGVVTLMMALWFMGGWLRSEGGYSTTTIFDSSYQWVSFDGNLYLGRLTPNSGHPIFVGIGGHAEPPFIVDPWSQVDSIWRREFAGFQIGEGTSIHVPSIKIQIGIVPYWSIVLPLTLISAFLLLTKPRKSTQKKIAEPTEDEGGTAT